MALRWHHEQLARLEKALEQHPIDSGRCAALARRVHEVAKEGGDDPRGHFLTPRAGRWILPKVPHPPSWASHTVTETRAHAVDALTGSGGCEMPRYLPDHWQYPDAIKVSSVDVFEVDPGIQNDEAT